MDKPRNLNPWCVWCEVVVLMIRYVMFSLFPHNFNIMSATQKSKSNAYQRKRRRQVPKQKILVVLIFTKYSKQFRKMQKECKNINNNTLFDVILRRVHKSQCRNKERARGEADEQIMLLERIEE